MSAEQNTTKPDKTTLDEMDAKIAALLVETPAVTDQEIANQLGVSRQTVNRRRNSPEIQNKVHKVLAIPEAEVRRLTAKALIRLEAFLDDEDPRIRLAASLALFKQGSYLVSDQFAEITASF